MRALAPSTLYLLRTGFEESFYQITQLVHTLPCFLLLLGENPKEAVHAVSQHLNPVLT